MDKAALARWLRERALERLGEVHPGVKPSVLRRAAQRVGLHLLGQWATCWDPVHLNGTRAALAAEAAVRETLGPLVDLACERLFHGHVVPIQRVMVLIDDAEAAALGKCVCRAAEVTSDLERDGQVYSVATPDEMSAQLGAVLDVYREVRDERGSDEPTAPELMEVLREVESRTDLAAPDRLALLWRGTYPHWEILLSHRDYTPEWRRNMARHGKAWPVDRRLLKALATAHYHVRGAVFTGMEVLDEPYALCTCPGPENDEGCSLVNWYYFSRLDGALHPNAGDFHGQALDADGAPLPCQKYRARESRPCLGCGCEH